jgi:type I restriction enzyme S subunit
MGAKSESPDGIQILQEIGLQNLPDDWEIVRIETLLSEDRGIAVGVMYPGDSDPSGIPLVRAGDLAGDSINPKPEFKVSIEKHREYKRTELSGGELLISLVGNVGRCAIVGPEMAGWNAARAVAVLRFKDPLDSQFVRFCLMSLPFQHLMKAWSTTTVQATLNLKEIRQIPIPWPPLLHRRGVVDVLANLDKKIRLNRQTSETLEAMARAIFKDWFVDFGPTRAKMAGTKPYLAPEIWKHFPDVLDDEGKPEGWQLRDLERFVEVNPIERLRSGTIAPYLEMAALPTSGPVTDPAVPRIFTSGMRFRNRDTLLARITPCLENGKTAYVQSLADEEVGWGSTEFIVFRARPPVPSAFTYLLARDPTFRAFAIQSMTGTSGRQRVNTEAISGYEIIDLPESLWRNLSTILEPLFNRIHTNGEESLNLVATRDLLLPKLMSGEIRVKEAEKIAA